VDGNTFAIKVTGCPEVDTASEPTSSRTVVARLTATTVVADALVPKLASPLKDAPMELSPNGRVVRSKLVVVDPSVVVNNEVPIGVPSSVKVTTPVGFALPPFAATVAVKETGSPVVAVLGETVIEVVVGRGATVSVTTAVDGRKSALPL
jgi:hypothetical protein